MRHNPTNLAEARKVKLWCDHCNTDIAVTGILSCLRKTCENKDKVPPEYRSYR